MKEGRTYRTANYHTDNKTTKPKRKTTLSKNETNEKEKQSIEET